MANIATPEFLSSLKQLFPPKSTYVDSAWYAVAAITFSASNVPEAVPLVLQYVLNDLDAINASQQDRLAAARKIRDAVFKASMIYGGPRAINALLRLHEATPPDLRDAHTLRNTDASIGDLTRAGQAYFDQTYGETAESTQALLTDIFPDLGFYIISLAYGYAYAPMSATSPAETSFAMISALIAIDSPLQIKWHLKSAIRNGATEDEVRAVRESAIRISKAAGVVWKQHIPDVE